MSNTLTIDGRSYRVGSAVGHEAVGEHFRVRLRAEDADAKPSDLVGKDFELTLGSSRGEQLEIVGIVVEARAPYGAGAHHLDLVLGPEAELLDHGQGSRVFLGKSSVDVVKAVLEEAGVAATWSLSATPDARPLTTQYRESDWSFADRILRDDGIYWFYDHDDGKLAFADDASKAQVVDGTFLHRLHHGVMATEQWVSGLAARTQAVSEKFTTRDRDHAKPRLAIEGSASEGDGKLEVYAWPARAATAAAASRRAKASLESLRARRVVVTGTSDSLKIRCGKVFEIESETETLPAELSRLFCVAVDWSIRPDGVFEVTFTAVPANVPFRLPLRPAARLALGAETAFVRGAAGKEIDADKEARVFAQPHWDRQDKRDDKATIRSRVGQVALARSMAIPRVGWSTLVAHHDGDVDRPWVMARLVDGKHPPPYKLPDEMTRTVWQTLTSASDGTLSEIWFDDARGAEQMVFKAARDMAIEIGNDEARTVGNRHVLEVGADRTVTVDADEKLTVSKDQTTHVKGAETTTVEGSRSITVKGKEEASIGGDRTEKAKEDLTTDVGKKRTLQVAGGMTAKSKKAFTREVLKKLTATAGGAWSTQAEGGIVVTTKGDAEETIAGARTSNGKEGVQTLVKGDLEDTVAAAHAVTAKGSVGESAKGKMKLTVGAAMMATAPQIEVVADSEITIACGGSTITIKSGEVAIKAPTLAVAGPVVTSNGAMVKHNP